MLEAAREPASLLLDGLLRGRVWVICVGVLLAGIVFANVSLLRLNADIARMTDRAGELRRQNAELRLDVARLGSSERIQRAAVTEGLVHPAPGDVRYLRVDPRTDGARAARGMRSPAPPASAGAAGVFGAALAAPVAATPSAAPTAASAPATAPLTDPATPAADPAPATPTDASPGATAPTEPTTPSATTAPTSSPSAEPDG